jgi:Flp pilus assembly pilin Flp
VAVVHNPGVDRAGGERGATAVAYAVMVAILALLLVGGVMVLSGNVGMTLTDTGNCVADLSECGGGGTGSGGSGGNGNGGGSTTTTSAGTTTTTTGP